MNIQMATNSQLSTTESKKKQKTKLSKQAEQEQNGDHLEGYQLGGQRERKRKMVQGLSLIGRYKTDRVMLKIA